MLFVSGLVLWDSYFGDLHHDRPEAARRAVVHALRGDRRDLIWIVHVYAAIWVKGTIRAMTRGTVTGGWAWRHHRKWLRQEVGKP